jgi:hypothetical protein
LIHRVFIRAAGDRLEQIVIALVGDWGDNGSRPTTSACTLQPTWPSNHISTE